MIKVKDVWGNPIKEISVLEYLARVFTWTESDWLREENAWLWDHRKELEEYKAKIFEEYTRTQRFKDLILPQ